MLSDIKKNPTDEELLEKLKKEDEYRKDMKKGILSDREKDLDIMLFDRFFTKSSDADRTFNNYYDFFANRRITVAGNAVGISGSLVTSVASGFISFMALQGMVGARARVIPALFVAYSAGMGVGRLSWFISKKLRDISGVVTAPKRNKNNTNYLVKDSEKDSEYKEITNYSPSFS